jgi:hypothetical protein
MSDKIFFTLAAFATIAMIALAAVWPQGLGRRSPRPFGHETALEQQERAAKTGAARPARPSDLKLKGPIAP